MWNWLRHLLDRGRPPTEPVNPFDEADHPHSSLDEMSDRPMAKLRDRVEDQKKKPAD